MGREGEGAYWILLDISIFGIRKCPGPWEGWRKAANTDWAWRSLADTGCPCSPASDQQEMDGLSLGEANAGISSSSSLSEDHSGHSIGARLEDKLLPLSLEAADGKHLQEADSFACTAFPPSVTGLMRYSCTWLALHPFSLKDPNGLYRHELVKPPWVGAGASSSCSTVLSAFAGSTLCP